MKKSKYNYRIYNGKIIKKAFENSRIYFMIFIFAFGIIIGSVLLSDTLEMGEKISDIIKEFYIVKSERSIISNFINSLFISLIFIIINIFLGFSIIGYPLLLIIPFFRGLGIGAICGYLYSTYKITGLIYCLLIIYPGELISVSAFLYACNSSCDYSKNAYLKSIQGRGQFEKNETKIYLCKQFIYIGISSASALIDAVFSKLFSGFFEI